MAQDHTFDIVSKINLQELHNALDQARKEVQTRFDFKGSSAGIEFSIKNSDAEGAPTLLVTADHSGQLDSVVDIVHTKMAKRGVSLKALEWKPLQELPSGGMKRQANFIQGISSDKAKEVVKMIKESGLKVQPRIDGDKVRVAAAKIDDLQSVIRTLQSTDIGIPLQFENYR